MQATELIEELKKRVKDHGDVPVCSCEDINFEIGAVHFIEEGLLFSKTENKAPRRSGFFLLL